MFNYDDHNDIRINTSNNNIYFYENGWKVILGIESNHAGKLYLKSPNNTASMDIQVTNESDGDYINIGACNQTTNSSIRKAINGVNANLDDCLMISGIDGTINTQTIVQGGSYSYSKTVYASLVVHFSETSGYISYRIVNKNGDKTIAYKQINCQNVIYSHKESVIIPINAKLIIDGFNSMVDGYLYAYY